MTGPGVSSTEAMADGSDPDPVDVSALRARIEALDRRLVELMAERVDLARRIGAEKRRDQAATLNPEREAAVIRHAVAEGRAYGLPEEHVRELFWTLVGLCRAVQLEDG